MSFPCPCRAQLRPGEKWREKCTAIERITTPCVGYVIQFPNGTHHAVPGRQVVLQGSKHDGSEVVPNSQTAPCKVENEGFATEEDAQAEIIKQLRGEGFIVLQASVRLNWNVCEKCGHTVAPKGTGQTKGIPDLLVRDPAWPPFVWRGIEVKGPKGTPTDEQSDLAAVDAIKVVKGPEAAFAAVRAPMDFGDGAVTPVVPSTTKQERATTLFDADPGTNPPAHKTMTRSVLQIALAEYLKSVEVAAPLAFIKASNDIDRLYQAAAAAGLEIVVREKAGSKA